MQRDEHVAKCFLTKVNRRHEGPEKITIDGSAANEAASKSYNAEPWTALTIHISKPSMSGELAGKTVVY